jgi:cation-transporting ATPase F
LLGKHWHNLPKEEVLDLLDSDPQNGLDVFEIKHRREHFGLNVLTPKKGKSLLMRFLLQFNNPLVLILLAASLVTAVLKDPTDALVMVKMTDICRRMSFMASLWFPEQNIFCPE